MGSASLSVIIATKFERQKLSREKYQRPFRRCAQAVYKIINVNTAAVSTQACSVASVQGIHRYMIDRKDEKDWASRVGTKSKEMYMMYMIS